MAKRDNAANEVQAFALRETVGLSEMSHVVCMRLGGDDAYDVLDAVCPADLYCRDGQILHTLLLHPDGRPFVDIYVCSDDEEFILLAEGSVAHELTAYLREHAPAGSAPEIADLGETHRMLSLNGPYAWELLAQLVGQEVIGLPYLSFFHADQWTCFRAGKTGEFGYDLLIPVDELDEVRQRLLEIGASFEMQLVDLAALDQCALENMFFNIRKEGQSGISPLELQLCWRVSFRKDYPGAAALRDLQGSGCARRSSILVSSEPLAVDDSVLLENRVVGRVLNAGYSTTRGDWVALALLDAELAHPGITFEVDSPSASLSTAQTVSPPVINNRSLYINLQKHTFGNRKEHLFPAVADHWMGHPERTR